MVESGVISLSDEDLNHVATPHEDALVITVKVDGVRCQEDSSSIDIFLLEAFLGMGKSSSDLKKLDFLLIGFAGKTIYPLGAIRLPVVLGDMWKALTMKITFIVVDTLNYYNTIRRCTTLNPNKIVTYTCHQKLKFPNPKGIKKVNGNQHTSRRCYVNSLRQRNQKKSLSIQTDSDPREESFCPTSRKVVRIVVPLPKEQSDQLIVILIKLK